jgi:hypothetical protein
MRQRTFGQLASDEWEMRFAQRKNIAMKFTSILFFRAFLLLTFTGSYVYLTFAKGNGSVVPIVRNVAWNDFVSQIRFLPDDSSEDSLNKEALVIQKFIKMYETERIIGVYDLEIFRAIDHARARLQKADKDL